MHPISVTGLDDTPLQAPKAVRDSDGHHDLDALIGAWDRDDKEAFSAAVSPFEIIDPPLWS
jgi:hypothetical protein